MIQRHFSIIIPTYNRASFLPRAIQSLLDQQFEDWEMVIVDDGSTDNTREVVEDYNDNRIKYHYQANQERSAARNNGIPLSTGRYICFLDSDDYYLPGHLSNLYEFIVNNEYPKGLIISGLLEEDEQNAINPFYDNYPNVEDVSAWIIYNICCTTRGCVERSIVEKHKFDTSLSVGEDFDLWLRVVAEYPLFVLPDHTVVCKIHDNRTVGSEKSLLQHLETVKKISQKPELSAVDPGLWKFLLSNAYFSLAQYYSRHDKSSKARKFIYKAFWISPVHRLKEKAFILARNSVVLLPIITMFQKMKKITN